MTATTTGKAAKSKKGGKHHPQGLFAIVVDWIVRLWCLLFVREENPLQAALRQAKTYSEYVEVGRQLDARDRPGWNEQPQEGVDVTLVEERTRRLLDQVAAAKLEPSRARELAKELRTRLRRNLGNMHELDKDNCVAVKGYVRRYLEAVCSGITTVVDAPDHKSYPLEEREMDLRNTRQSFGSSALLFSGGASLGMFHFGVVRLLHEEHLLPRVMSGSSIGSMVAALVAVRTDDELNVLLDRIEGKDIDFGQPFDPSGSSARKLRRLLEKGVIMDIAKLEHVIRTHTGDLTFLEAYRRTGRIVNITVSSTRPGEMPLLLNYLTAPDVLLWSASAASCALPLLYEAVELFAKDSQGRIHPYHPSGLKFSDGSVQNDLPMRRLSELFNVNQFIVSQVNPHMQLLLHPHQHGLLAALKFVVRSELRHRTLQLARLGLLPKLLQSWMMAAFAQDFSGDITILPRVQWKHLGLLLSNPTPKILRSLSRHGYRSSFPLAELIRNRTTVERALEDAILTLNARLDDAANASLSRARKTHSTAFLSIADTVPKK